MGTSQKSQQKGRSHCRFGVALFVCLVAAIAITPGAAMAQGTIACTDDGDAIETGVSGDRSGGTAAAGSTMTPYATYKDAHYSVVSDLTVTVTADGSAIPLAPPTKGQSVSIGLTVPDLTSVVVTFTWNQAADDIMGYGACAGTDSYEVRITPSKSVLAAYLARLKSTQATWAEGQRLSNATWGRVDAVRKSYGKGSTAALFAGERAAGRVLGESVPGQREINARYAARVRASRPPIQLAAVNAGLASSGAARTRFVRDTSNAMSRVSTLAYLTRLKRLITRLGEGISVPRAAWRKMIVDACEAAGIPIPAWASKVGT